MIQKEVAERLASQPGNKTYGILSILMQAWYDVEYLFTVEPNVFNPAPKVKSAVIRMTRNKVKDLGCNEKLFKRVVKLTFNQRRKMMRGSLKPLFKQLDGEILHTTNKDHKNFLAKPILTKRPEQLSVKDFIQLTNDIDKEMKND